MNNDIDFLSIACIVFGIFPFACQIKWRMVFPNKFIWLIHILLVIINILSIFIELPFFALIILVVINALFTGWWLHFIYWARYYAVKGRLQYKLGSIEKGIEIQTDPKIIADMLWRDIKQEWQYLKYDTRKFFL